MRAHSTAHILGLLLVATSWLFPAPAGAVSSLSFVWDRSCLEQAGCQGTGPWTSTITVSSTTDTLLRGAIVVRADDDGIRSFSVSLLFDPSDGRNELDLAAPPNKPMRVGGAEDLFGSSLTSRTGFQTRVDSTESAGPGLLESFDVNGGLRSETRTIGSIWFNANSELVAPDSGEDVSLVIGTADRVLDFSSADISSTVELRGARVIVPRPKMFLGLGDLPGGQAGNEFFSRANGVSADGLVVVGTSRGFFGEQAFAWDFQRGFRALGLPSGSTRGSAANGVSADGSVVVGQASFGSSAQQGFVWDNRGDPQPIGGKELMDVSDDGTVVVGVGNSSIGGGSPSFIFDLEMGTGTSLSGEAFGLSADGRVAVGTTSPGDEAYRWTATTGEEPLGNLPGGDMQSTAFGVSADGLVVVGTSESGATFFTEAFRWDANDASPTMQALGDLPGGDFQSIAFATSGDGAVVVGSSRTDIATDIASEAFLWDAAHGMRRVVDVLADEGVTVPAGWVLETAFDISDDASVVVGSGINPDGNTEAWYAVLTAPEPGAGLGGLVVTVALLLFRGARRRA